MSMMVLILCVVFLFKGCYEVFNMGDDSITLHLHHGRKFVKGGKLKHDGGSYRSIKFVDMDRLSYLEVRGIAREEIRHDGLLNFFSVIPGCSMESGLRNY